MLTEKVKVRS